MARTPITLAALATSAVSGLEVTGYRGHFPNHDRELSAVLETNRGEVLVQLPTSPEAEVHHSAKILGQSALTPGVREQLPFAAPEVLGVTRSGDTRAIVSTYLSGDRFTLEALKEDAILLESIAASIASIHALPVTIPQQQGLRIRTQSEVRLDAEELVQRSYRTGMVPELVKRHWEDLLGNVALWEFHPVVIHGSASEDTLLVTDDVITGVLDWSQLSVGDPAVDLAWLLGASREVFDRVIELYADIDSSHSLASLRDRSVLWHELELAKWLLYGVERGDDSVIEDAVVLFDQLVTTLSRPTAEIRQPSNLEAAETAAKPASVPESFTDTQAFDMLDEDRVFDPDPDFLDDEAEQGSHEIGTASDDSSANTLQRDEDNELPDNDTAK